MKTTFRYYLSACAALLVMSAACGARAQSEPEVGVSEHARPSLWTWDRAGVVDYSLIGGSVATIVTARVIGPAENRWSPGGVLVDEAVRDRLLLRTRGAQHAMADASDLTLSLVTSMPMLDATIVGYGYYRDPVLARELAIMSIEVTGVLAAMQTLANSIAGRERPYGRRCGNDLAAELNGCVASERHYSFFSGHTSQSFAAAAVTCSVHAKLKLYGPGLSNVLPCIVGFSLAAFTGSARIMADYHYFSDVVTGAVVGTLTGFAIPYYRFHRTKKPSAFHIMPTANGVQVGGQF